MSLRGRTLHVAALALTLLGLMNPRRVAAAQPASPATVVIGYLEPAGDTAATRSFRRGIELGIVEAVRAGQLLGREVRLVTEVGGSAPGEAAETLRLRGATALIASHIADSMATPLGMWSSRAGVPVVLLASSSVPGCDALLFRISPPLGVSAASLIPAGARHDASAAAPASELAVELWHPSLQRFGAAQLSDRYRERYGADMDSDAWAGWMAVKILWESALRAIGPVTLGAAISRGAFDGHKGTILRFGADRLLRQPLFIVEGAGMNGASGTRVVAEVAWPDEAPVSGDTRDSTTGNRCNGRTP